jgi:hypothetical protein
MTNSEIMETGFSTTVRQPDETQGIEGPSHRESERVSWMFTRGEWVKSTWVEPGHRIISRV